MHDNAEIPNSFDLGIAEMDAEHRGQLERMNRLRMAIEQGRPSDEVAGDFGELIDYLDTHFMSEQITMREHGYPGYDAHLREHDHAMTLLRQLETRCLAGDAAVSTEILQALRGWLVEHVQTLDRSFAAFMKQKGFDHH